MKHPIRALAALLLATTAAHAHVAPTLDKVKADGSMTVAYRESSIPFSYLGGDAQPTGFGWEICGKIVEQVEKAVGKPDLKVATQAVTSQNRIPLLVNGTIDIECGSTTNNSERGKQVAFAINYFYTGTRLLVKSDSPIKSGNSMQLRHIPVGSIVHNIELKPGKGGQMMRSAGTSASFTAREGIYALLRLKSGESRKVHVDCRATIGEVSNDEHNLRVYGKAGAKRWLGIRPTVRGQAMNPVDHPHGGGEGKSGQGNPHQVSPWGQNAKGLKTRTNKRTSNMIVQRRQNRIR